MSRRLAVIFRRAARRETDTPDGGPRLTLTDLLGLHGESSAAVLLMLLAMLSMIPGASLGSVLGFVIVALAWRWHRSPGADFLPERVRRLRLGVRWSRRCLQFLAWTYATAHRFLKARWTLLCHHRTQAWWSTWIALMGLVILLPLPLGNLLPSLSLVLLSLGWMFRDGLALLASALVGSAAIGYTLALGHVLVEGAHTALAWLDPLL